MNIITLNLPIIGVVDLEIYDQDISNFTKRQLENYVVSESFRTDKQDTSVVIKSNFKTDFFNKNNVFGRQYKVSEKKFNLNGFVYEYHDGTITITMKRIDTNKPNLYKQLKTIIKHIIKPPVKQNSYAHCHWNFYCQVLFPIFSLYTITDGYFLIHASLINYNNKNILVTGLDGVGKSSIANYFEDIGGKILSDNFVLYNGKSAIPFNMAIRLEPNQETNMKILYADHNLKEALPLTVQYREVEVNNIFILSIGEELVLSKSSNNICSTVLFTNIAPEIGAANNFIAPFLYNSINKNTENKDIIKCITIPKGKLKQAMEILTNEC